MFLSDKVIIYQKCHCVIILGKASTVNPTKKRAQADILNYSLSLIVC